VHWQRIEELRKSLKGQIVKFSTRELILLAVFGALWGLVEISLGSVLHTIHIPMAGMFLAALGLVVALAGRLFVPRRGSTLFIGAIAMVLKLFSIGAVVIGPMVGILAEALVAEIILSLFERPTRLAMLAAGAGGVLWTLVHPFVTNPLLFGRGIFTVWLDLLDRGTRLLGLPSGAWFAIVLLFAAIHISVGLVAGALAWTVGHLLQERLPNANLVSRKPLR
jgi:hypothetical protein